jgi:hypothetical protein
VESRVWAVLSCFAEFTFFHTLADEPVDEGALAVHHIEFAIKAIPCLSNSGSIGTKKHASVPITRNQVEGGGGTAS